MTDEIVQMQLKAALKRHEAALKAWADWFESLPPTTENYICAPLTLTEAAVLALAGLGSGNHYRRLKQSKPRPPAG